MDLIQRLFTEKELLIMAIIIGVLVLLVLIITIIDVLSNKKDENEEFDCLNDNFTKSTDDLILNNQENSQETKITLTEIKEENSDLLSLKDGVELEVTKIESNSNKENSSDIEEIELLDLNTCELESNPQNSLIMEFDEDIESDKQKAIMELNEAELNLNNKVSLEDTICNLEAIEEENAIISYQELLENTSELNFVEADSGDEVISLKEIMNMYKDNQNDGNIIVEEAYNREFTSTPHISPVSGFEKEVNVSLAEIQLENTANLEKLDKEIRKTNKFLNILNDLKKNLD